MRTEMQGVTIGITGVNGVIGRHLAERCLALGASVKGLDLHLSAELEIEFIEGDTTSPDHALSLCEDCDVVIHAAELVNEGALPSLFEEVKVEGTRKVVLAARAAGVRRFLQVSSVMVHGFSIQGEIHEGSALRAEGSHYCQSKIHGERIALTHHVPGEFEVTVIRCGDVYGPGSIPWTIRPVQMMNSGLFMLPSGGSGILNPVYIGNLVDGMLLALKSPVTGDVFNITDGGGITCREFFEHYARMLGLKKLRSVPAFLLRSGLQLSRGFLSAYGIEPQFHPDTIPYLTRRGICSISRARKVLGYEPRSSLAEGMARTEDWLRQEGFIKRHSRQDA